MLGQSVTLPKSKETGKKVIKFMKKAAFESAKKKWHINAVEFFEKPGSQDEHLKVEISFRENGSHFCLPKECLIGPIDEEDKKSIVASNNYCLICFNRNNKNKKGIFMLIKLIHA